MGASTSTSRGIGTYFLHVLAWVSDFHSKCSILLQYSETQASGTNRRLLAFRNFIEILVKNPKRKQARCQVSGIRCRVPGARCQVFKVPDVRCQVSGVRYQVSGVRC